METRICKHCKKEHPIEYFERADTVKGKIYRRWSCKDCRKIEKRIISLQKKDIILNIKKKLSCEKCGESKFYMLDFHHKDPSKKEGNIGTMTCSWSEEKIIEEIEKCNVLCANHHRELHYLEREKNINIDDLKKKLSKKK